MNILKRREIKSYQANYVSQDVLVSEDLRLLILSQLLEVGVRLVKQQVDQEPEGFLEQHREHQPYRNLILKYDPD